MLYTRAWVGVPLLEPGYFPSEGVTEEIVSPFPINYYLCINLWRKLETHQLISFSVCVLMGPIFCK